MPVATAAAAEREAHQLKGGNERRLSTGLSRHSGCGEVPTLTPHPVFLRSPASEQTNRTNLIDQDKGAEEGRQWPTLCQINSEAFKDAGQTGCQRPKWDMSQNRSRTRSQHQTSGRK
jgi:hypothetical protein